MLALSDTAGVILLVLGVSSQIDCRRCSEDLAFLWRI